MLDERFARAQVLQWLFFEPDVRDFITDMSAAYAGAALVVCRAGATTLAELTVCRKPSILVPFPFAADNHQVMNAKSLVDAGAAVMIEERDLTGELLAHVQENDYAVSPPTGDGMPGGTLESWIRERPVMATSIGVREHDDRLDDESPEALAARRQRLQAVRERAVSISEADLPVEDRPPPTGQPGRERQGVRWARRSRISVRRTTSSVGPTGRSCAWSRSSRRS